jgi:sugar lactone lactonase YvrE
MCLGLTDVAAVLFRRDVDGTVHRMAEGMTIPNGMSWSVDNRTLYLTDTSDAAIFAYDYDEKTGDISNKREFFKVPDTSTGPDGHAEDEEGNLWVAVWGSWKVLKVSPQGEVVGEIQVPTRCPTVSFSTQPTKH